MVRQVKVYQNADLSSIFRQENICFIAIVSLKRPTPKGSLGHQRDLAPHLKLKSPYQDLDSHELAPDIDTPQWIEFISSGEVTFKEENHPIEVRKVNMGALNDDKEVFEKTQVRFSHQCYTYLTRLDSLLQSSRIVIGRPQYPCVSISCCFGSMLN